VIRRLTLAFAAALAATSCLRAQQFTESTGDTLEYSEPTREAVLKGHARVSDGTMLLLADEIRYTTSTVTALGHVEFTHGDVRVLADKLIYHLEDGSFTGEQIRIGNYPFYATGSSVTGSKAEVVVNDASVTFHEPGPFVPRLSARRVTYTSDRRVRTERGQAGVGPVLPIRLPRFQQRLNEPTFSHVSLIAGNSSSLGLHLLAALHVPIATGLNLGADVGIFTKRGLLIGPSGSYAAQDREQLNGHFRSGYINDHGDKKVDVLGRPVPEDRAYVEWEHHQQITDQLSLTAQLNYWKDSEVLRDFRYQDFFRVQEPDTFVESVYTGQNYFVSAFARFQPNKFQRVQQRLPEVRFDLLPIAVGNGFYEQFNAGAAVLREAPLAGSPRLATDRLDAYYALTRPFTPREWLGITPVVGGRVTHYANSTGALENRDYTRTLGEVGVDAELRSSATFNYTNEQWKIDGLRHLMTPRLSYRYIPEGERGGRYIPSIDRRAFSTYLQPLGLGATRNIDDLHAVNTLRLGLDNTLQTRDRVYGSRDLLIFNAAADLRYHRDPGERDVSEVHTEFALMPAPWVRLDVYESFAPRSLRLREFNSGLTVHDGDAWSVRLANQFLRDDTEQYDLEGTLRLNEAFETRGLLRYDARKHRLVEQSYGVRQNLANTWLINYAVTLYGGPRRESHFGFSVRIDSIGF
jgi:LPS-assembly protein